MNKPLRVAFISRPSLLKVRGGDTVQMLNTAKALKQLNVEVDIYSEENKVDYRQYDLLHFFNLIRPASILQHTLKADLPYVLSPIYVDYSEVEKRLESPWRKTLTNRLGKDRMEYLKVIGRYLKNGEPIGSPYYLLRGHATSIRRVLTDCSYLLPNSESEMQRLKTDFNIAIPYQAVPNAVDADLFNLGSDTSRKKGLILCVGRIESRKNQLNLIRAVNDSSYRLLIIGKAAPNQASYYQKCQAEAGENIEFLGELNQESLDQYYHQAEIHALPSWFETTGLSNLEAAICGCKLVMSRKGDEYEYFQDDVWYCEPDSPASIRAALDQAAAYPAREDLRKRILEAYTWKHCAEKTRSIYEEVLS